MEKKTGHLPFSIVVDSEDPFENKSASADKNLKKETSNNLIDKRSSVNSIGKDSKGSDMVSIDLSKKNNKFRPKKN